MIRSVASKVMWVGRAAIFMVGLAVVLFLTLAIVAEAADARRVPALKKGVVNTVKSMTTLVGTLTSPILKLDNNGTGPALQLEAEANQPPLVVNADAGTATNLDADELDGKNSTDFVSGTGSVATIDERFSDPDGPGGAKGFSSVLTVPGAQIRAACLEQSSGIEMFLNRTSDVTEVSLWRDDGGANPTATTLHFHPSVPTADSDSSPVSAADRVIWRGSSAAGTFTAVLFTRYEKGSHCHLSGYVLSALNEDGPPPGWDLPGNEQ